MTEQLGRNIVEGIDNPEPMAVIRAFIALDLSPEIQDKLEEVLVSYKKLLPGVPVRWVPAKNIHITLKFLGDVSITNIKLLTDMIQTELSTQNSFEISVGGSGAFPNFRQPRIIWVGVEAPPDLADIQTGIESGASRLGYVREERPFSPHLTLGRVSRNITPAETRDLSQCLEKHKAGFLGAACIREVHLYKSDLQPTGAVYSKIFTSKLLDQSA